MAYRVTEYDETGQGRPSFLVESDNGDPLEYALFVVLYACDIWRTYHTDGPYWPHPPRRRDAVNAARTRYRELQASGHYL